jgi:hypothetical protein
MDARLSADQRKVLSRIQIYAISQDLVCNVRVNMKGILPVYPYARPLLRITAWKPGLSARYIRAVSDAGIAWRHARIMHDTLTGGIRFGRTAWKNT